MSILQSLVRLHARLASNDEAPSFGFSKENISFAVVLSPDGKPADIQDRRDTSGKRPGPRRIVVPRPVKRTGQPAPNFLWDKTAFVFGVKLDSDTKQPVRDERTRREHAAFKEFHNRLLAHVDDPAIQAFLRFMNDWRPEKFECLHHAEDMLDTNVVFRLDGEHELVHERSSAKDVWLNYLADEGGAAGLCLVTGEHAPIARLHPSVKGVAGAQGSGASVVSFEKDAFKSFGKERGANAPVSERAAFGYTASLNTLLERDSGRHIRVGDTTTVFWAEAAGNETDATAAEDLFSMLAAPPTDEQEAAKIANKLSLVEMGRPLAEIDPDLHEDTRFYILGIAPNAARLSIRFWHEDRFGDLARRIGEHFRDMRIEPVPWRVAPATRRLLMETAVQGKAENIPPTLGGALMRSILTGGRYPRSLVAAVIARMRADGNVTGLRAAICKAALARDHRLGFEEEDVPVSLNPADMNPAYRLGRLFAIYESVQRAALGRVNATIKDRYFAAASSAPASVFPLLERGSAHHLATLRKSDKGGLAHWFDGEIDKILAGVDSAFPRRLCLEDQGRFAIGYHHQRGARRVSADEGDGDAATRNHRED